MFTKPYVGNNPGNFVDPFGLSKLGFWGRAGMSLGGFGIAMSEAIYYGVAGVYNTVRHPIQTVKGIPLAIGAIPGAVQQFKADITSSDPYRNGLAIGRLTATVASIATGVKSVRIPGSNANKLSRAAGQLDRNNLTKAGRALQKHSSRSGSAFKTTARKASDLNKSGQSIVDDILKNPRSVIKKNRHGGKDVIAPNGKGIRYNAGGTFRSFLEP